MYGFYSKSNLTYILWLYTRDGTDVRTDSVDTICPPLKMAEAKKNPPLPLPAAMIAGLAQL